MRTKSLKYLFLLSTAFLATGCGGGSTPTHEHHFGEWTVDKAATCAATGIRSHVCEECGAVESEEIPIDPEAHEWGKWIVTTPATCEHKAIETRTCEYCSDHKETREGEGPLDHHYVLSAEGEFKKEYEIGDTFNSTGMTVYKICTAGCGFKEEFKGTYNIEYQEEGQTAFKGGDTKVYLVEDTEEPDKLSGEIDVVVNLKKNAISGIGDTAELHCKEALDLTGVTCTSGDPVSVKYYSDKDCTKVISSEDLVAGNDGKAKIYYAKIVSSGQNPDYEIAEKVVELTVSHGLVDSANLVLIGYAKSDCVCGYHTEDTNLMTDELCIFEAATESGSAKTSWGGTYDVVYSEISQVGWVHSNLKINNSLVYVQQNTKSRTINLSKVNYTLFDKVTFVCKNSNVVNPLIQFTLPDGTELLPSQYREDYLFECSYDEANTRLKVVAHDITNNVTSSDIYITDSNIINGKNSLQINSIDSRSEGIYNQASIVKVLLNHTCSPEKATEVLPTDAIGAYDLKCSDCGRIFGKSTTKFMSTADVDLKHVSYGESMAYSAGQEHPEEAKYEVTPVSSTETGKERYNGILYKADYVSFESTTIDYTQKYDIALPKVQYSAYTKVEFDLVTQFSGWVTMHFHNDADTVACTTGKGGDSGVRITVTKDENGNCTLTAHGYGTDVSDTFNNKTYTLTENEANGIDSVACFAIQTIISGGKALSRHAILHELTLTK